MNQASLETTFLECLRKIDLPPHEISRLDSGHLLLDIPSPCQEVGFLRAAVVAANEIVVYCKITHAHCSNHGSSSQPLSAVQLAIAQEAVEAISGFLSGSLCASVEHGFDGRTIGYGFGPASTVGQSNEQYRQLIQQQYGGPSTFQAWSWAGEIPVVA
ncbi:hypothetical protein [Rhodanobacter hydrolyticus]|uniref:Uncharacterized protein n=1 Tax=Rhodanobacter hydrolyticus TaxID=2250595 RepID=A0ABW8J5G7_9GAMM